ncbi:MAG: EthD domain-containing protein [Acidimicrobiales bacterium]|nr:EthD domain-containing protein [Acidimicrobiales bacterium]
MTAKLIRFLPTVPPGDRWTGRDEVAHEPARVTLATSLELPGLPPPRFAAVVVLWRDGRARTGVHSDDDVVAGTAGGAATAATRHRPDGGVVVEVDEVVARGADALAARWADGGARFKMMSFGRRNPALTRAEFVERWRAEAGRLGGDRIPDDLRGSAYVQDHPSGDDPPFDALNEVWFDRLDDLRRRAEWFAARPVPAELMSPADCWSLYLRERVVVPAPA